MKTLGILGGMGPMATACFMERITAMTAADTDQEQIPVIVYSNTQIPDRSAYLLGRPQAENPVTALRQTAHFLDGACDYIAMPCVTAHAFYTQIQQELSHAVLFNMVELTVQSLKAQNIKKAGLLATDGTIAGGVFKESLKNAGIESVLPGALSQKSLMALIYRIKAGKEPDMAAFNRILPGTRIRRRRKNRTWLYGNFHFKFKRKMSVCRTVYRLYGTAGGGGGGSVRWTSRSEMRKMRKSIN